MKRINKLSFLFLVIHLCIFVGALNNVLTLVCTAIAFVVSIVIANESVKKKNSSTCVSIIILLCLQNFLIGLGAHLSKNTSESLKILTQIPFMVILINWLFIQVYLIKHKTKRSPEKKYFILLIAFMLLSLAFGRGEIQSILINIRNMTIFFMGFEIGKTYLYSREKFELFIKKYNSILFVMLLAGLILMAGGYGLYSAIGINEGYIAKSDVGAVGVLNYRFFTTISNFRIMRMGSLYYEPVNLAYLYSIGFLVNLLYKPTIIKAKKATGIIISGLGLMLTFGKGGILIAACAILFVCLYRSYSCLLERLGSNSIRRFAILLVIMLASVFCVYAYNNISTSANPHFWGIIRTWENVKVKPLGHGLGTGGNMAFALDSQKTASFDSNNPWLSTGGESAIFAFMYQIGILGTVSLALCAICMSSGYKRCRNDIFMNTMKILPVIIIGVGILQENTFTPQCIIPFMIFQGGSARVFIDDEKEKAL